jgi:phosphoglycerol geranylgeranyltransferase
MHFIYLEGGSGASNPVPPEMISASKQLITVPLIVGGGIKTKEQALAAATAGADVIVTGNLTESGDANERISQIIAAIKDVKQQKFA